MKTILYLGTSPAHYQSSGRLIHYPVIKIVPRDVQSKEIESAFADMADYTHIIFTSKNAVRIFFSYLEMKGRNRELMEGKCLIAVGKVTAFHLKEAGHPASLVSEIETQEGIIEELRKLQLEGSYFLLPKSSISRPALTHFFSMNAIRCRAVDLYDTQVCKIEPAPDLESVDEIVFTSPSTVQGFMEIFGSIPKDKKLVALGPITEEALQRSLAISY